MTAWRRAVERALASEVDGPPARSRRRDWLADAGWFAFAAVFGVLGLVDSANHGLDGPLLVLDAVLGVAACLSVWWRRRWPVALALATVAAVPLSSSAGAASVALMFTVAAWCPWPLAVLVLALHLGALPLERVVHPQGDSPWSYYPLSVVGLTVFVVWGAFLGGRRESRRERARRAEAEDRLRLEQARHAERARIAREMHDVLAHRISLLSLHAGALEFRPDASPEEVARAAGVIRASAHQALEDLREVIGLLRDGTVAPGDGPPSPPQPTLAGLPGLLEESRTAGMTLRAEVDVDDLTAVPEVVGRHAFRIVQEALTNARKHAPSAGVDLRVAGAPGKGLEIEVSNPAPVLAGGAPAIPGSGTGLVGLGERVALSGGSLDHGVDERGAFRLRAWLPWPA